MSKKKHVNAGCLPVDLVPVQAELPTVPDAFRRTDYEGCLIEAHKRWQLKRYQRTQAERVAVLKQINQLQTECLALARNEANWRHFQQEDRLRQKRLDLEELELDQRMDDLLYEREMKLRGRSRSVPAPEPKRLNLADQIAAQLEEAIRTEAAVKESFVKARKLHPHLDEWLSEWEAKVSWDLRERKWS